MIPSTVRSGYRTTRRGSRDPRLIVLIVVGAIVWAVIVGRLFTIQVLQRKWYAELALGQREFFQQLYPERGEIFVHDRQQVNGRYPIATNQQMFTIYAVPRDIREPQRTARKVASILKLDEASLAERLAQPNDAYEPLKRFASREERDAIFALNLPGIAAESILTRRYPDGATAAALTGFVGEDEHGTSGRYGIEGTFDALLAGTMGYRETERDPGGRAIVFGKGKEEAAKNGSDIVLTIEREVQAAACQKLDAAIVAAGGSGGTVVILNPINGAVRALCSAPSYDPNHYEQTTDFQRFNALAVSGAYEPGSVFKPITVAAAIDAGVVSPDTAFRDTGSVTIAGSTITNTDGRVYGTATVADVLRFSINTGAIFVANKLGVDQFRAAVERFGFGALTDIELVGEVPGDTKTLAHREPIYLATASYGQGITVTPLQLATAYAALANGGKLMQPYLVEEVIGADGSRRRTEPRVVRQVVSQRTATLLQGMLVSVVQDGYPKRAGVPGYLVGGKTGTAQIPYLDRPGYSNAMIHTFAGIGPVDRPTFAMVIRIDRPTTKRFADSTTAPLFGEIAKFLVQYDGIAPRKE